MYQCPIHISVHSFLYLEMVWPHFLWTTIGLYYVGHDPKDLLTDNLPCLPRPDMSLLIGGDESTVCHCLTSLHYTLTSSGDEG